MKHIRLILQVLLFLCLISCEQVEIEDAPNFDHTEILSFKAYGRDKASVIAGSPEINAENQTIRVTLKGNTDMTSIFATCTLSAGANISPALDGYSDWSSKSKTFTVTSASGKRKQQWTITFQ